jgi:hypothetical protein
MAEEPKDKTQTKCNYVECGLHWLKGVDDWSIGGFKNKLPRLYYIVIGLLIVLYLL